MKNTIISSNKNHDDDEKSIVGYKIQYFQQLIQKSVLSRHPRCVWPATSRTAATKSSVSVVTPTPLTSILLKK